jgi:serine/threonine protein kinase/tetratricopeptide (TPR) repeat protein
MIGRTVSHYKILEKLGEGGMGVVYKAEDTKLRRIVALKFLPSELTRDAEAKARFIQEAQAASALDHSNICAIHEIDETADGQLFISMAHYEGETLKERIKRGPLAALEAIRIAAQIGQGLVEAHSKGIIHRDIKPANIMITKDGIAKILDFGLAKLAGQVRLTRAPSTLGTVAYMSPEQASGKEVDERSDIWSLGVVLFEMLTGQLPFRGDYEQAMVYSILNEEAASLGGVRPDAPKELQSVVAKALEKAPDARYRRVIDMLADLESLRKRLEAGAQAAIPDKPRQSRRTIFIAISACVVVAAALVLWRIFLSAPRENPITSIAVLPFQNISADPEQEYFSDGMTEALIAELSKISALRVISRTSIMRFKKSEESLPEIARKLNVDAVIEGSVQRSQDDVRVTAQLVRAEPEKHLWANTYTQSYQNILALESDIAQEIAGEIRIAVTPQEKERLAASRQVNPQAHEAYLKGHFYVNIWTLPEVQRGLEYLERAVALDSTFALAYVDIADAYDYLGWIMPPAEWALKVKANARKALSIDPSIAKALTLLGDVKFLYDWDWKGAEADYKKAIELNPNDPTAHAYYAVYLSVMGKPDEAIREAARARALDPLDLGMIFMLGSKYYHVRQYDEAERIMAETVGMDSACAIGYTGLARIRVGERRFDEAVAFYRKAKKLGEVAAAQELPYALARAGMTREARSELADLIRQSGEGHQVQSSIAATYVGLGERDSAFVWLEKAYETRDQNLLWLRLMPMFDDVRSDPRYAALVKKLGLEP